MKHVEARRRKKKQKAPDSFLSISPFFPCYPIFFQTASSFADSRVTDCLPTFACFSPLSADLIISLKLLF